MHKISAADYIVKILQKLNIEKVFGLPGDFNFEIVEAIEKNQFVNWVGSTNELNAGYAADGYARIKGFGALVTTYGVGELSAINAICGSMAENVPVVKIVGIPSTQNIKNKTRLHHNLVNVDYEAFKRAYSSTTSYCTILTKKNIKKEIQKAFNILVKTKTPVYIAVPMDVALYEIIDDDFEPLRPKSNPKNLKKVTSIIINEIKKAKKPCVLGDVLAKRFNADKELNAFLRKTKIPSTAFLRGMGVIDGDIENYFGIYSAKLDNKSCYDYINTSDCIIAFGVVISDLNTIGFDYKFDLKNHIDIKPDCVYIRGKKYKDVLIKDLIKNLYDEINYVSKEKVTSSFNRPLINEEKLTIDYFYNKLEGFFKENDIILAEVGLVNYGLIPIKLPCNTIVENQMMWGSIGWATGAAEGVNFASENRTILITGDGSHQISAQELSTMKRNNLKPIIFVINNSGYTVERILCRDVSYKYNDIADWDYLKLLDAFKIDAYSKKVSTPLELAEALENIEKYQNKKMCYIEIVTDYLDIPYLAYGIAKNPQQLEK